MNVLTGGNGGGGFDGYYDLMLDANENDYDVLLIEVCDMTVGFCDYCFDFDIVALTNMGNDHMDVHGSMEGYRDSLKDFFKCKTVFLNDNQIYKDEFEDVAEHMVECSPSDYDLKLFGIFNKRNAGIAENICRHVGENFFKIDESIIQSTLEDFTPVKGRLEVLKLNDCNIYIGKTDNSDAFKTVLNEVDFKTLFIGTPRHDESHRFEILDEVVKSKAEVVVLFPGLEDTLDQAVYRLHGLDYSGRIELANNLDEIMDIESHNVDKMAKKLGIINPFRWKLINKTSRDNARTPMQWTGKKNAGFTGGTPWLKLNPNYTEVNVEKDSKNKDGVIAFFKKINSFKKSSEVMKEGSFRELYRGRNVYVFEREYEGKKLTAISNFASKKCAYPVQVEGRRLISNYKDADKKLRPYEFVLIENK